MTTVLLKVRLIQQFGGTCQHCGYSRCRRALQFHHLDPSTKERRHHQGSILRQVARTPELFQLLCANCHFEHHDTADKARLIPSTCRTCRKSFLVQPYRLKMDRGHYCSWRCKNLSNTVRAIPWHQRFRRHIETVGEHWLWTASTKGGTRPQFAVYLEGRRISTSARQASWVLAYGRQPKYRLQTNCGEPLCVRPEHLAEAS